MGMFRDDQWYCDCRDPLVAKWYTSGTDATKGDRFVRCPETGKKACKFFLWEKDEAEARASSILDAQQQPPLPQTPSRNQRPFVIPTPTTRGDSSHRSNRTDIFRSPNNTSPTPQRYRDSHIMTPGDKDPDLFAKVAALLQSENIALSTSTEVQLRHLINLQVEIYETKIRMYHQTVDELSTKLAEAERSGSR